MRTPTSTYRLQLHGHFDLHRAAEVVGYLHDLGVTDVYTSPILASRAGSAHGYDVVDPTRIDPELGGPEGLAALSSELRVHGMGLLLDIVPNHMAAGHENPWWWDVLERGPASPYGRYFDIDWDAGGGKIVLPVLGGPYGEVLETGELRVVPAARGMELRYHDHRFPLAGVSGGPKAKTGRFDPGRPGGLDRLRALLEAQAYRLVHWRASSREMSYRRFFDITDLVSVRTEDPEVFAATHRLVLDLVARGEVTGLRVDHIDGLHDPESYLERLSEATGGAYVVVEKILDRGEALPASWATAGTTGYEFLNALGAVSVDPAGAAAVQAAGDAFTGSPTRFGDVVHEAKRLVLDRLFGGEVASLGRRLADLAARDRHARDLDPAELTAALRTVTVTLDVYRTYIRGPEVRTEDRERIAAAVKQARELFDGDPRALAFLADVLLLRRAGLDIAEQSRFVMRWQQLSGPAMAKGFEDTALYRYVRLASRNDVGGDPGDPAVPPSELHGLIRDRRRRHPHGLNTTSTHDTKRSEDVRARIDVLSELPEEWSRHLDRWSRWNAPHRPNVGDRPVPDRREELLIYQTLLGIWPLDERELRGLSKRLRAYVVKAAREAKVNTSWRDPDPRYERALERFVVTLLAPSNERFRRDFLRFQRVVAYHGALNSLAQLVVKLAAPGVPDLYQGSEQWHLALVDPDNRRPIDFDVRRRALERIRNHDGDPATLAAEAFDSWADGGVKLLVTHLGLAHRRAHAALYLDGSHLPLDASGAQRNHVVAFARRRRNAWSIAVVPRLTVGLAGTLNAPVADDVWKDTRVRLPEAAPATWRNVFTGQRIRAVRRGLPVAEILSRFPVALLEPRRDAP